LNRRFAADLMPALEDGSLRPIVDRTFALGEIVAARVYLEADKHVGKNVIWI
jgi:NADPH:quinone reductase